MSICFDVQSSAMTYSVAIETGRYASLLRSQGDEMLVADDWFATDLAGSRRASIAVPAMESSKSLDAIPEFVISLKKAGVNRDTRIIAVGGGIIQDVVSFITSVYMRGLKWSYFPTTLLAMVDSCIGGKSSINVGPYKNLVGTFHPPEKVIIDPTLALSLDNDKLIGGLVEAAKICYCRGTNEFEQYMSANPQPPLSIDQVGQIALMSLSAKKWFIEVDEFDKAERLLLNFGHTFGHAIEGASNFEIEHGLGVGLGILCALEMGRLLGRNYSQSQVVLRFERHIRQLLAAATALPVRVSRLSLDQTMDRFKADKKHGSTFFSLILVSESGAVERFCMPRDSTSLDRVSIAFRNTLKALSVQNSINSDEI